MRFLSTKGIIRMQIDLIQNNTLNSYTMRIIDSCVKEVEEEVEVPIVQENGTVVMETQTKTILKVLEKKEPRFKTMTYDELDSLTEILNVDMTKGNLRENLNELFRRGLLAITQKECVDGISGEVGRGLYFTEAKDWEIVKEDN
ncbi:MAG TPA: hypothetical protein VF455_02320 [Chryseobacterium sp.]